MNPQETFVTRLRRQRLRARVSIEQIADSLRIKPEIIAAFEANDLSEWPKGLYSRAWIRTYALAVDLDPVDTVDEFCRLFPQGDRRSEPLIRGQAQIVGHDKLEWRDRDHVPVKAAAEGDRRGAAAAAAAKKPATTGSAFAHLFVRLRRAVGRV